MRRKIYIKCPYCGVIFTMLVEPNVHENAELVICPPENGGCEMQFVLIQHWRPTIQTISLMGKPNECDQLALADQLAAQKE